jgi:hypothetical protein
VQHYPEVLASLPAPADVSNIIGSIGVESRQLVCAAAIGKGFQCNQMNDGCGNTIDCGTCDSPQVCGTGTGDGSIANICWCPPGTPNCTGGGVVTCGGQSLQLASICQECDSSGKPALQNRPNGDVYCSDGNACNGVERCFAIDPNQPSLCVAGPQPLVDDGDPCTDDVNASCDPATGRITYPPSSAIDCQTGSCFVPPSGTHVVAAPPTSFSDTAAARISALEGRCSACATVLK